LHTPSSTKKKTTTSTIRNQSFEDIYISKRLLRLAELMGLDKGIEKVCEIESTAKRNCTGGGQRISKRITLRPYHRHRTGGTDALFGLDFEPYSAAIEDQFKVIIVPDALAPTTTRHTVFIGRRKWPHLGFAFL
jgi:hypothetical protein